MSDANLFEHSKIFTTHPGLLAYYVCIPISSIGGIASIGTRSYMVKIVGRDEIGKVMSFVSTLDQIVPVISSTMFTYIFKYTIETYPGTIFEVTALLTLIPINIMMWIDLFTERPLGERKVDEENAEKIDVEKGDRDKTHHRHHHGHHKKHHHHGHKHSDHDKESNDLSKTSGYESDAN